MLQSETPSLQKTKTTKSEPKQSLIFSYTKDSLLQPVTAVLV